MEDIFIMKLPLAFLKKLPKVPPASKVEIFNYEIYTFVKR